MGFIGPIEDRLAIRERYDTYSDAVFRSDLGDYLACWSEDGVRTGDGGECSGIAEIRDHWNAMWEWIDRMTFFTQLASVEVEGVEAAASAFSLEMLALKSGGTHQVVGSYRDRLVCEDGIWRFVVREYRVLMGG
jgi:ketosteroid isomerase-like protein